MKIPGKFFSPHAFCFISKQKIIIPFLFLIFSFLSAFKLISNADTNIFSRYTKCHVCRSSRHKKHLRSTEIRVSVSQQTRQERIMNLYYGLMCCSCLGCPVGGNVVHVQSVLRIVCRNKHIFRTPFTCHFFLFFRMYSTFKHTFMLIVNKFKIE